MALERTLFIYDSSAVQNESDDPLMAIRYFSSCEEVSTDDKCLLCRSLVALHDSVNAVTRSPPKQISLLMQTFALARVEGHVTVAIGCKLETPKSNEAVESLNLLVKIVRFRFGSFVNLLERYEQLGSGFNLEAILRRAEKLEYIRNELEIQTNISLFLEECARKQHFLVACHLFQDKEVHSQFDPQSTRIIVAASHFPCEHLNVVKSKLSTITWTRAFMSYSDKDGLFSPPSQKCNRQECDTDAHELAKNPVKEEKEPKQLVHCPDQPSKLPSTSEQRSKSVGKPATSKQCSTSNQDLLLVTLALEKTKLLFLTKNSNFSIERLQSLELYLCHVEKQLDSNEYLYDEDP